MKFKFGEFELEEQLPRLTKRGQAVALPMTPLRILTLLVRSHGELVSFEELRRTIWPDRTVEFESSIHTAIRQIRRAIEDDAASPRYIIAEPRRGYRFVGPVEFVRHASNRTASPLKWGLVAALAAIAVLAGVSWHFGSLPRPSANNVTAGTRFSPTPDSHRAEDRARRRADRERRAAAVAARQSAD